jgi:signal transduction histidine kinase
VLLNLVINARDAIVGDGGTVTVRTAEAAVEAGRTGWPDRVPPGRYIAVTVSDTGCGMSDEVKARIFEPFFTTKGDRGHGIGLATVRDVVRQAGGYIEVESAVGWGTTVRVFWPGPAGPPLRLVE